MEEGGEGGVGNMVFPGSAISLEWSLPVPLAGPAAFSSCSAGSIP